jgi:hypothetical protein
MAPEDERALNHHRGNGRGRERDADQRERSRADEWRWQSTAPILDERATKRIHRWPRPSSTQLNHFDGLRVDHPPYAALTS